MSSSRGLNPIIEKFYLSILSYAGLSFDDNIIKNVNDKLGDITIDGKHMTLPYFDNLKNPEGCMIFHLLNENYTTPENTVFNFYKKRLVLELNLKFSYMIINLITVASDVQMQQKIKSSKLINIISNIGETDMILNENFAHMLRASKKANGEAFLFDIFLKKNGEINDTPYSAIGKINFIMANEIAKSLEDKERDYKVFGYKPRKKDLLAISNIFNILFPDFQDKVKYSEGTDNKVFRYLNILLKTSYMISDRLNELCMLLEELKEPTLKLVDCYSDLEWVNQLEDLYGMSNEIRLIPNQLDISVESKHRLSVDETSSAVAETTQQLPRQEFVPIAAQAPSPISNLPQIQQAKPTQSMSAEDIIRGNLSSPQMGGMMPNGMIMTPNGMMTPMGGMMPMNNTYTPSWVQQESMAANTNPNMVPANNNIIMTPQGPAMMTPQGPVLMSQMQMPMQQTPMNSNMMPMGNNMMPMGGMQMPMGNNMMPMGGMQMPMGNNMMPMQYGIEPNPLFMGR